MLGYDQFEDKRLSNNYQSGSSYWPLRRRRGLDADGIAHGRLERHAVPDLRRRLPARRTSSGRRSSQLTEGNNFKTDSVFVNDKWRLNNNWSFNLGVRYDKNDGKNANGAMVAKDSKISPRLGVTFDPNGDGSMQFNASYAKYVTAIANTIGDATLERPARPASIYYAVQRPGHQHQLRPGQRRPTA